jgi:anti-sigma factor RsiW
MSHASPLNERERADLVAFLDGELKGDAARRIESRIAHDPAVREEADAMRRAWELLDFLPVPEPSVQFTHHTLSRVSPATMIRSQPDRPGHRRLIAVGWAAAILLAMVAGYGTTRIKTPRELGEQDLVRDLRVIENKRLYDAAEDLDFVRDLDVPELFGEDAVGT